MNTTYTYLKFRVEWPGEVAAGIRAGEEEVTIAFRYGQPIDDEIVEYWKDCLENFYDGSKAEFQGANQ